MKNNVTRLNTTPKKKTRRRMLTLPELLLKVTLSIMETLKKLPIVIAFLIVMVPICIMLFLIAYAFFPEFVEAQCQLNGDIIDAFATFFESIK